MSFTWDSTEYQYRDFLTGRLVPRPAVRAALDDVLDAVADDIEVAAVKVVKAQEEEEDDDDPMLLWLGSMESGIKTANVIAATIAVGGALQVTEETKATTAERIATQYEFLRGFVDEIREGLELDERFVARSRMYGLSGTGTFEDLTRRGMKAVGYTEERRHLASVNPCASCIAYAGVGWVPIGTLPGIGESCECHSNCRCAFEYRIRR